MKTINSHQFEYDFLVKNPPLMHYDKSMPFTKWQELAREKLTELLGLPFEKCDPETIIEYVLEEKDFTDYRMLIQTEKGYNVPCHLWLPKNAEKSPLTICLSGHGGGMHIAMGRAKNEEDEQDLKEWYHRAMAVRAIKQGRAALIVEARNFGESSLSGYGTSCTEASKIALLMGRTVIGERVWDVMRILDVLETDFADKINFSDIVCTGNSGGGTATYYLACLEQRITAAAPSCSVCTYEHSIAAMEHCMCNHIPSIRKYFEMGDLAGLIAPRKLVVATGRYDGIFPLEGALKTFDTIKELYTVAGVPNNCALTIGESGHLNYADEMWAELNKMGIK
ncbi:MAG: hypothetical protein IJZ73_01510 [Clostridia bacterium]|nr:hypothetical protein [Clostridia bacterium]